MDHAAQVLQTAHEIYARNETATTNPDQAQRPPVYKAIGISLAIGSGLFIGTSFVLKKMGLLKANEKYSEVAGEGYGYLKNFYWWGGMSLMILGEGLNFVAYAFTDAILVTPLGALSVVITTILSAIFLKERLSMVGKVACFLCIVGSVVIVMNAPQESSVANIQQMQKFVITPGFLSYTGVILIGSAITAFYFGPKYGKKNMLVYISICSWVGGLSVVATQGLGSAIIAQAGGTPQFNQWFIYVLLVFVIGTLLTEIIFLNKALNLFNAAMVTPTYYVYFTSTTIITSTVLFQGFKGTPTSIITVVMGFLTICSGVVLLQLSKSAKDVPDVAVFAGDLDQIHTIAEQEQPETEPKADAIRGAAAIVRRFSVARQKMEIEELRRLHEEKVKESLEPLPEEGPPQYEWDGLRRRKTILGSQRGRAMTSPNPFTPPPSTPHPPLGWSRFPTEEELAEADRPTSPALSSIVGTIRNRARSVLLPGHPDFRGSPDPSRTNVQSPMHPVQLTEIAVPAQKLGEEGNSSYYPQQGAAGDSVYSLPPAFKTAYEGASTASLSSSTRRVQFGGDNRPRGVSNATSRFAASEADSVSPPTPPPHSARRQFSFQNVFRRHQAHGSIHSQQQHQQQPIGDATHEQHPPRSAGSHRPGILSSRGFSNPQARGATEEERLGLVKGDSRNSQSMPALQRLDTEDDEDEDSEDAVLQPLYTDEKELRYGPSITHSPARRNNSNPPENRIPEEVEEDLEEAAYNQGRERFHERSRSGSPREGNGGGTPTHPSGQPLPPLPPPEGGRRHSPPRGGNGGAFI